MKFVKRWARHKSDSGLAPCLGNKNAVISVADQLRWQAAKRENGPIYPANGGTETPIRYRGGRTLLYCWQPSTGRHMYLDTETDIILSDEDAMRIISPEMYR
jgi:hypothetical protein